HRVGADRDKTSPVPIALCPPQLVRNRPLLAPLGSANIQPQPDRIPGNASLSVRDPPRLQPRTTSRQRLATDPRRWSRRSGGGALSATRGPQRRGGPLAQDA